MITPLSKQGGRRYGQMRSASTGLVSWLRSVGTTATVLATLVRRTRNRRAGARGDAQADVYR